MVDASTLHLLIACVATFLIGINGALIYRFWPEPWFITKCIAVSGLLTYISLSVLYGDPSTWRAFTGLAAVVIDCGAIATIWRALNKARTGTGYLLAYKRR